MKERYVDEVCRGLERYRDKFWKCEVMDASGKFRCQNYWESHQKGHQFDPRSREYAYAHMHLAASSEVGLLVGQHECSWEPVAFRDALWKEIGRICSLHESDRLLALADSAKRLGLRRFTTQLTCLACLASCPTNMLPCRPKQHAICEDCGRIFSISSRSKESVVTLAACPLGCPLTPRPWRIQLKPKQAQPRILALDG